MLTNAAATYVCFEFETCASLGAVSVPPGRRSASHALKRASTLNPGIKVAVSAAGACDHCGAGYVDVRDGEPLICTACGSAFAKHREVDSVDGERWALVRPGTGDCGRVVAVFTGSREHAEAQVRGKQWLRSVDSSVERGALYQDGAFYECSDLI